MGLQWGVAIVRHYASIRHSATVSSILGNPLVRVTLWVNRTTTRKP